MSCVAPKHLIHAHNYHQQSHLAGGGLFEDAQLGRAQRQQVPAQFRFRHAYHGAADLHHPSTKVHSYWSVNVKEAQLY